MTSPIFLKVLDREQEGTALLRSDPHATTWTRSPAPPQPGPSLGPLSASALSALLLGAAHGSVGREERDIKFSLRARTRRRDGDLEIRRSVDLLVQLVKWQLAALQGCSTRKEETQGLFEASDLTPLLG